MTGLQVIRTAEEMSRVVAGWRMSGLKIGFVPTMGALHRGHLSLVDIALANSDRVVVSIFLNPKQFGPQEDLEAYPRDLKRDIEMLDDRGVSAAYVPGDKEVYPDGFATSIRVSELTENLCGAYRPGHFDGVTTVCTVLFNTVSPDVAVFGRKDAQQLAVIRRLVQDLRLGLQVLEGDIVREQDGLAMSSRNAYLSPEERKQAPVVRRALLAAAESVSGGETEPGKILDVAREVIEQASLAELQYIELVDPHTMKTVERLGTPGLLAVAVYFGSTRLIDNIVLEPPAR